MGNVMSRRKRRREFMPMSTAGILTFSQESSEGLVVPKWFPVALAASLAVAIMVLHLFMA